MAAIVPAASESTSAPDRVYSVLGIGLSGTSSMVPDDVSEALSKSIETQTSMMKDSPFDWEVLYVEPDVDFDVVRAKMRSRAWDIILIGIRVRADERLTPFFEKLINTAHQELPRARFALNTGPESTLEACNRIESL